MQIMELYYLKCQFASNERMACLRLFLGLSAISFANCCGRCIPSCVAMNIKLWQSIKDKCSDVRRTLKFMFWMSTWIWDLKALDWYLFIWRLKQLDTVQNGFKGSSFDMSLQQKNNLWHPLNFSKIHLMYVRASVDSLSASYRMITASTFMA